ncbi:rhodanese-like domain-containing protein [Nocardia sp. alder85J]|uniref:rhodanese-like domain-containing protein n=1 Tax=Nocardia sp. alder85J TaxID=2862949 RepID=UPI001CD69C12|nr:rhodanese-like domain-containing protein [Nocardia sp. alder85J]MCX4096593.1 rhodanese-like domain-containing protein [Nocardia sp. alder85J]
MTSSEIPSVPVEAVPAEFDTAAPAGSAAAAAESVGVRVLLDVREDDEWQLGHAPGAVHIPMDDVPARLGELAAGAEIYVVCRQGGRSLQIVRYLTHFGFDAVNVAGGMVAWQQSGRPLAATGPHEPKVY